jgi:hypothetical protein
MLGSTLIWDEVIQVGEPCEKRLLASTWVMKAFHGEQLPLDGIMGLIQQGAGHRHLGVFENGIPARLFVLHPAPHPRAIGGPSCGSDMIGKAAQPLAERKHPQTLPLSRAVPQGVELRA